jgi:hypothetical protein
MTTTTSFLSLPPEIRNRIYIFALTPSGVLEYFENDASSGRKSFFYAAQHGIVSSGHGHSNHDTEYNQLQYVNRQLHSETAGLELKYAPVLVFNGLPDPTRPGGAQALRFLMSVSLKRRAWLSYIVIYDTPALPHESFLRDTPETLTLLDQICSENENLCLCYHPPAWDLRPCLASIENCIFNGAMYALVLRGDDSARLFNPLRGFRMAQLLDDDDENYPLVVKQARAWRNTVSLKAVNFRFFPRIMDINGEQSIGPGELAYFYYDPSSVFSELADFQLEQWYKEGL